MEQSYGGTLAQDTSRRTPDRLCGSGKPPEQTVNQRDTQLSALFQM
jgi:hypothetical protein